MVPERRVPRDQIRNDEHTGGIRNYQDRVIREAIDEMPQAMKEDLEKDQGQLQQELPGKMRPGEPETEDWEELEEALHDTNDPEEEGRSGDQDTPRELP